MKVMIRLASDARPALYLAQIPDKLLNWFGVAPGDRLHTHNENGELTIYKNDLERGFKIVKSKTGNVSCVRLWVDESLTPFGGRLPGPVQAEKIEIKGRPALQIKISDIYETLESAPISHAARRAKADKEPSNDETFRHALQVARRLSEVFDPDRRCYCAGHDDKTVADALDLAMGFVTKCRETEYGPLANGNHEELRAIKEELKTLKSLVIEQVQRIDSLLQL